MRPGREIDCVIAEQVFGHRVFVKKRILHEETPKGERPLRFYTKEMAPAWEVAEKMSISMIPIEGGQWFALVGSEFGWKNPAEFITYMQTGKFVEAGAAVGDNAPMVICLAALKAVEARKQAQQIATGSEAVAATEPVLESNTDQIH